MYNVGPFFMKCMDAQMQQLQGCKRAACWGVVWPRYR